MRAMHGRHRSYHSPWRLFFSLCRAGKLPWSDRWLLWRLAREAAETAGAAVPGIAVLRCRRLGPASRGSARAG